MSLEMTPERRQIQESVKAVCDRFDDAYWLKCDNEHRFPDEFRDAMAAAGWLGIAMPEEYGGAGLGVTEASLMMQTVGNSAGFFAACSAIHVNVFGPHSIVVHGTDEQKRRMLPPLIRGEHKTAFGVTEPDAGLDTTHISTRAVRRGDKYIVNGQKVWTTTAQSATKIMLLTRTTPLEECVKPTDGMTLFYTDLNRDYIKVTRIPKMGRAAVDSNSTFIADLPVPVEDHIGPEGKGFKILLDSLNPERILIAAESVGMARRALDKATKDANERIVFGRQIGKNQGIQHPLAENWMEIEVADLMVWEAARRYDKGEPCGSQANAAKYLAAEACFTACDRAVRTHGGFGYAKEYHVERYFRESILPRNGPVSRELILLYRGARTWTTQVLLTARRLR